MVRLSTFADIFLCQELMEYICIFYYWSSKALSALLFCHYCRGVDGVSGDGFMVIRTVYCMVMMMVVTARWLSSGATMMSPTLMSELMFVTLIIMKT